jgi:hypothetical protein
MATFHITSAGSVLTTANNDSAFESDTANADMLTVDEGAFLIATGVAATGAFLANTGTWTVLVNGSIFSGQQVGLTLDGAANVTIGANGEIGGQLGGIQTTSTATTITNLGVIAGTSDDVGNPGSGISLFGGGVYTIINRGNIGGLAWAIRDAASADGTIKNFGLLDGSVSLGGGTDTLINSGHIAGLVQAGGTANLTNSGTIDLNVFFSNGNDTINNSGMIGGNVVLAAGTNTLTNSGWIGSGVGDAISSGAGNDTINNSGTIDGDIDLGAGNNKVTNDNLITGRVGFFGTGAGAINSLANSGTIGTNVFFGDGTNTLSNSGAISGFVSGDAGIQKISNAGTIGDVDLGNENDSLVNSGIVAGYVDLGSANDTLKNPGRIVGDIDMGLGNDMVTNSKVIEGELRLGDGTNTVNNSGTIANDVQGGSNIDTIINWGTIGGGIQTSDGDDVFTNFKVVGGVLTNGTVSGIIDLGAGSDSFNGGSKAEELQDNDGGDTANFRGGSDTYTATYVPVGARADGNDLLDGGTGIDTYEASASGTGVLINLGAADQDLSAVFAGAAAVLANTAQGDEVAGAGLTDSIFNFENANGGSAGDTIYGSNAINRIDGGDGNDFVFGFGGNDVLLGGAADDVLAGGPGKDLLTGGTGTDTFAFLAIGDSGATATTRDVIADFEDGTDVISFSEIDANTTVAGNDAFDFIGTNVEFSGVAGELRAYWTASGQIIEGDINGDATADFSIKVTDANHHITLGDADFLL